MSWTGLGLRTDVSCLGCLPNVNDQGKNQLITSTTIAPTAPPTIAPMSWLFILVKRGIQYCLNTEGYDLLLESPVEFRCTLRERWFASRMVASRMSPQNSRVRVAVGAMTVAEGTSLPPCQPPVNTSLVDNNKNEEFTTYDSLADSLRVHLEAAMSTLEHVARMQEAILWM